jgi:cytosine deaminase
MIAETRKTLLRNVLLQDGSRADVGLRDGLIDSVTPPAPAGPGESWDLSGYLLLPAPVETHAHLDKAFTADTVPNPSGDLAGAVSAWIGARPGLTESIGERAARAIESYVASGVTAIRTHADLGPDIGLAGLAAIIAVPTPVPLQVIAFAPVPLSGVDGAANRELTRQAAELGATGIGACPGLDPDPLACLTFCLDLAQEHGLPLDLHVDEWLDVKEPSVLELLADAVLAREHPFAVTASHCVSLSMMPLERAEAVAGKLARAGISVICLPQTNLYLQARDHRVAPPRGITPLQLLRDAGVAVAAGSDNLQDPFHPLGRADPLETAALLVQAAHDTPERALAAVSGDARKILGLSQISLSPGSPAELLAIRAGSVREAIALAPLDRIVLHRGQVLRQTAVSRK